jgi:prepilin-type N-terminal cleavage/methylation domain-containing protein
VSELTQNTDTYTEQGNYDRNEDEKVGWQMRWTRGQKGVTLVELMITLVIFSVVISMIYSVFNALIKQATSERKTAKTEMDVINVAWPLIKEIQSAGFGAPKYSCSSTTQCDCHISVSGTESATASRTLTIHSTAAGNSEHAGKWSYISATTCGVAGLPDEDDEASTQNRNVVIISSLDKSRLGYTYVKGTASPILNTCSSSYENHIAYWTPATSIDPVAPALGCYETQYSLGASAAAPATCATGTQSLRRSVSTTADSTSADPILDCVLYVTYRFGCISSSGALTWQAGTDCGTSKLRLVKVGMIVQNSMRRDFQVPDTITLFGDLSGQSRSVTVSPEQRYYKWRTVEQTIILKNLE